MLDTTPHFKSGRGPETDVSFCYHVKLDHHYSVCVLGNLPQNHLMLQRRFSELGEALFFFLFWIWILF